jgi:hypothetical protein
MRPDALRLNFFRRFDLQAERFAIECQRGVKVADGDSDMIQHSSHAVRFTSPQLELAVSEAAI